MYLGIFKCANNTNDKCPGVLLPALPIVREGVPPSVLEIRQTPGNNNVYIWISIHYKKVPIHIFVKLF